MIELVILCWLKKHLEVPVYLETPDRVPKAYVRFEKTSEARRDQLYHSTFAFQSYAGSLYETAALNEKVKKAVDQMIELPEIGSVSLNSNYNYTDTELGCYRYQAVYDLTY